jgi:integrase
MWSTPVEQITRIMIEDYLVSKRRGLSVSTVKHIRTVIKQSLDRADLPVNPATGVRVVERQRANGNKQISAYNEEEVELLLETFRTNAPRYYLMVLFMVRTGCRTSEVAALRWDDLDLDNRIATISRGLVRGRIEDSTKSGLDRDIDLTPQLTSELKKAKLMSGGKGLVFKNPQGNAVNFNLFRRRAYSKMVARAGLKPTRLHDLRHTYASILLKKCRDILYVQRQLGHSKPSITLDVYSHFLEDDSPTRMVDALDNNPAPNRTPDAPKQKAATPL